MLADGEWRNPRKFHRRAGPIMAPVHFPMRTIFAPIVLALAGTPLLANDPTYWQDVRPALRKHCTVCHQERRIKEIDISGGLALDSYEAVVKGPKRPIVPGKSADSPLIKLLLIDDENKRMPQGAPPLPEATIALLRRWIDSGAKEGTPPATVEPATKNPAIPTRKLDVVFSTDVLPPPGLFPGTPAKLQLALQVGPLSPVATLAFSPDGKLLAAGSYGLATIWNLESVQPARTLTGVLGSVSCLRFNPAGTVLAVAGGQPGAKGEIRLFAVADWKLLATLPGHADVVSAVAFTADGKKLASASFDKTVRVWDLESAAPAPPRPILELTGHSDFVYAVSFTPDGKAILSASKDRTVKLVESTTGKGLLTCSGSDQDVLAVAVSPDGKQLVSSGLEPQINWWNPRSAERIRRVPGHGVAVHELQFSSDGKLLVSAGGDRTVRMWHGDSGILVQTIAVGSPVYGIALSADGKRLAAGSFDGLVRVYDITAAPRHLLTLLSLPPSGETHDWLALTPAGHLHHAPAMIAAPAAWRMGGKPVPPDPIWQALRQPDAVARTLRGEAVPPPAFGK
jgi:WD40 repeat protein